jgi:hypothetical protein
VTSQSEGPQGGQQTGGGASGGSPEELSRKVKEKNQQSQTNANLRK